MSITITCSDPNQTGQNQHQSNDTLNKEKGSQNNLQQQENLKRQEKLRKNEEHLQRV